MRRQRRQPQRWRFLVIKDKAIKQAVAGAIQARLRRGRRAALPDSTPPPGVTASAINRQLAAVEYLTDISTRRRSGSSPAWMTVAERWSGASIYPAVQNMLLAARALGWDRL